MLPEPYSRSAKSIDNALVHEAKLNKELQLLRWSVWLGGLVRWLRAVLHARRLSPGLAHLLLMLIYQCVEGTHE